MIFKHFIKNGYLLFRTFTILRRNIWKMKWNELKRNKIEHIERDLLYKTVLNWRKRKSIEWHSYKSIRCAINSFSRIKVWNFLIIKIGKFHVELHCPLPLAKTE